MSHSSARSLLNQILENFAAIKVVNLDFFGRFIKKKSNRSQFEKKYKDKGIELNIGFNGEHELNESEDEESDDQSQLQIQKNIELKASTPRKMSGFGDDNEEVKVDIKKQLFKIPQQQFTNEEVVETVHVAGNKKKTYNTYMDRLQAETKEAIKKLGPEKARDILGDAYPMAARMETKP